MHRSLQVTPLGCPGPSPGFGGASPPGNPARMREGAGYSARRVGIAALPGYPLTEEGGRQPPGPAEVNAALPRGGLHLHISPYVTG